jgi:Nif-specific regulatory protein
LSGDGKKKPLQGGTPSDAELARAQRERDRYARALAELNEAFESKVEELSLIRQAGDELGGSLDLRTVCAHTVDLVQSVFDPEHCSLMLRVADGLVLAAARGAFDEVAAVYEIGAESPRFRLGEGIAGVVAASGDVIRLDHAPDDARFRVLEDSEVDVQSLLCLPLTVRDKVVGVLSLSDSTSGTFELRHERILAIIANTVAMAVENARLFSELRMSRESLANENENLRAALGERFSVSGMVGNSQAFRSTLQMVEKVAPTTASILITGESGTGKEMIARAVHQNSPRKVAPFVAINCAALPESLLEAELFGIERGVATGVDARAGTFERASGGTLFLDEIGDMDLSVQAKVLRVIQERQVVRVGGSRSIDADVRLVAATHRDLEAEIAAGRFRQDLYYRLRVVRVVLPPLRERREDILPLAEHFIARFAARHGRDVRGISRPAARALLAHEWPGNVRELEHTIEQAVVVADAEDIQPDDLGLHHAEEAGGIRLELPDHIEGYHETIGEVQRIAERRILERVLQETGGNRTRAARALGLARRTLLYKIKALSLD